MYERGMRRVKFMQLCLGRKSRGFAYTTSKASDDHLKLWKKRNPALVTKLNLSRAFPTAQNTKLNFLQVTMYIHSQYLE